MKLTEMAKLLKTFKMRNERVSNSHLFSNFSTLLRRIVFIATACLILSGCEKMFEPTLAEICDSHPQMCNDLNQDSWCRAEKAEIIRLRYDHQNDQDDGYKYPLLLEFEGYLSCIEKAAQIEHIKHRDKETTRLKGVLTARKEINRLSRETRESNNPYLAHYHWSRYGDKDAFKRFVRYVNVNKVDDPQLLVFLAQSEIKNDSDKTIRILYDALALYSNSDDIDQDIFNSLSSIGMNTENYRLAYVWLVVAAEFNDEMMTDPQSIRAYAPNQPYDVLDAVASEVIAALKSGEFNAASLKLDRL